MTRPDRLVVRIHLLVTILIVAPGVRAAESRSAPFSSFEEEQGWPRLVERYLKEGRLDLAQKEVEGGLATDSLNVGTLILSARISISRLRWSEAESRLREAIGLGARGEAHRLLQQVLAQQGKHEDLSDGLTYETSADLRGLILHMSARDAQQALVDLEKQRASRESDSLFWVAKARALRLLERPREALTALNRAIALAPDLDLARFEAARFWESRGRLNRAAEHLSYLVAIHPENARATYRLARIQMLRNRPDLAIQVLKVRQYLFPSERWITSIRERLQQHIRDTSGRPLLNRCQRHTIAPGDTLVRLAQDYLGDRTRWIDLQRSNRERLQNPRNLPIGLEIEICAS